MVYGSRHNYRGMLSKISTIRREVDFLLKLTHQGFHDVSNSGNVQELAGFFVVLENTIERLYVISEKLSHWQKCLDEYLLPHHQALEANSELEAAHMDEMNGIGLEIHEISARILLFNAKKNQAGAPGNSGFV